MIPETAKRAREVALEAHRAELKSMRKMFRWYFAAGLLTGVSAALVIAAWTNPANPGWRGKQDAPPMQRVKVITDGYVDKSGQWRAFDNGEPITVTLWKP